MNRLRFALAAAALALAACDAQDPVADEANELNEGADVDVLPPDESVATPSNELANGVTNEASAGGGGPIPASMHGRWALTPEDCRRPVGGAEGAVLVSGNELRFYESVARPLGNVESTPDSVSGDFAFVGEGESRTRRQSLRLQDNKLIRTESAPGASYTYARCSS